MKDNQAKYPQLRFKGFTDPWEERKSKDIFKPKIRKGEPDLPVLSVTQTSGVVYRDEVGIDIKYDISTLKNYKVIEPNDFVISLRSFQGGFELSDKLGITSPAYTIFVPKSPEEQNNLFWKNQFKRFQFIQSLKTVTFGIRDGKSISFNEFGDLKIKFPSNILEQQKIGAFFKELDNTIALHQRKLAKLKELKQGYLQKMFPKNGSKFPQLRFAGFADAWEQRKLGELGKIYTGNTPKTSDLDNWTDNKEGHIWITPTDIDKLIMSDSDRHLSEQGWSKARKIPKNSVLITSIASIGKNTINAVPVAFNQQINAIVPEKNNSYFILSAMIKDTARFASVAGQTATAIINKTTFEKFQIATPSYEEQQKIGSFFKQLDNTITLHQRKLDLLKEQKKGFLQKMFV